MRIQPHPLEILAHPQREQILDQARQQDDQASFHDQVYDVQNQTVWEGRLGEMFEVGTPEHHADILEGQSFLPADAMVARISEQVPDYQIKRLNYRFNRDNTVEVMVDGERTGYAHRGPDYGIMAVHAYTGEIMSPEYLPGHQGAYDSTVTSFFALHFGNFGGAPVRWSSGTPPRA